MPAKRRKRPRKRGVPAKPAKRTPSPKRRPKPSPKPPAKRKAPKPAPKPPAKRKAPKPAPKPPAKRKAPKPPPKPAPRRKAPAKGRKAPKPARKSAAQRKRSSAAKAGWAKRRIKQQLLDKMVDIRLQKRSADDQPLGWVVRRQQLREIDGDIWRRISVEYDPEIVTQKRLEILKELQADMLTKEELYDWLSWVGEESDIDIGDMYEMYLGYTPGGDSEG